jgi:hypothetical protein
LNFTLLMYLLEKPTVPQLEHNNLTFSAICVFIFFVFKESATCLYSASDESNQSTNPFSLKSIIIFLSNIGYVTMGTGEAAGAWRWPPAPPKVEVK